MASVKVAVDMGTWYYMWNTNKTDYDGIADELGVIYVAQNTENRKVQPFLRGVNNEKPVKIKIGYGKQTDGFVPGGETVVDLQGYCTRMASPTILGNAKAGSEVKELVGKTIKVARRGANTIEKTIISATVSR